MKTLARAEDRAEISRRLRGLEPSSERRWGRMSVHQMVCHVGDTFRMATGEQPLAMMQGPLAATIIKVIALYTPLPWPKGKIQTSVEINQGRGRGTAPTEFAADLVRVVALYDRVTAPERTFALSPTHPAFGRMSEGDWMRWGYLHTDHHLRQFGA